MTLLFNLLSVYAIPTPPSIHPHANSNTSSISKRQSDTIICDYKKTSTDLTVSASGLDNIPICHKLANPNLCTISFLASDGSPAEMWLQDHTCCRQFFHQLSIDRVWLNNGYPISTSFMKTVWVYVDIKWNGQDSTPEAPVYGVSVGFEGFQTYPLLRTPSTDPVMGNENGWSHFMGQFPCWLFLLEVVTYMVEEDGRS